MDHTKFSWSHELAPELLFPTQKTHRKKRIISFAQSVDPSSDESPTHIISEVELHQFRGLQPITRDDIDVFLDTSPPQAQYLYKSGSPSLSKNIDEKVRSGISMLLEEKPTFRLKKILE